MVEEANVNELEDCGENKILPHNFEHLQNNAEDIQLMLDMGFDVDDDDAPAPENVPGPTEEDCGNDGLYDGQSWGWSGFCERRSNSFGNSQPRMRVPLLNFENCTYITMFLIFSQEYL